MSIKRLSAVLLALLVLGASACGTLASPTSAPAEPAPYIYQPPAATSAPDAYQAPAPSAAAPNSPGAGLSNNPGSGGPQNPNNLSTYDTFFQNYGVNPRIDTQDDPLSTFGLDVDTGAYTVMRSYVDDGSLPPVDSVRVEEYINYFNQDYPNPPEGQAFGINIDGGPDPFEESGHYQMLRIGIQGYAVPEEQRQDVALTFVIDTSGSMGMDNRLGLVQRALRLLVDQLRPSDSVSLVAFGTDARVVLDPTPGDHRKAILSAIDSLEPEGVTNAEAGLRLGYQMADEAFNPQGLNRVILCSDGVANMGETGAEDIWDEIQRYAGSAITLTTVGVGTDNYNDTLMEQLADKGNGFYTYVDTLEEARRIFVTNLTSTLQVIAKDARVQVEFNPEVVARYRLVGYENRAIADQDFRNDNVNAGELGAGHSVTALYEVKLYEGAGGKIASVHLRWQNPNSGDTLETSQDVLTDQLASDFRRTDPHFQWTVTVAEYAEILRNSYWAQGHDLSEVLAQAQRIDRSLEDPDADEFVDLVRHAVCLSPEE